MVEFKKSNRKIKVEKFKSPLYEIFSTKLYMFQVFVISLQGGVLWTVFYGMATSVQDLGLKNVNQNGIFFGVFQCIGYIIVLPFIDRKSVV